MDLNHLSQASKITGITLLIAIIIFCLIWCGNEKIKTKFPHQYYPVKHVVLAIIALIIIGSSYNVKVHFSHDAKLQNQQTIKMLKTNQNNIKKLNQQIDTLQQTVAFDKIKAQAPNSTNHQIKKWLQIADQNENKIESKQTTVKKLQKTNSKYYANGAPK